MKKLHSQTGFWINDDVSNSRKVFENPGKGRARGFGVLFA